MIERPESVMGDRIAVLTVIWGGAEGLRREGIEGLRGPGEPFDAGVG